VKIAFILITGRNDSGWSKMLYETLLNLGSVQIVFEDDVDSRVSEASFDLIVLDACAVKDSAMLVSQLCSLRPRLRILVTTAAPNWREARDILRAGAVDYYLWPQNREELFSVIQDALNLPSLNGDD